MRRTALLTASLSLVLLAIHAASADLAPAPAASPASLPPPSPRTDVTYAADIRPIFEVNCLRCHGADRARGDIHLDTLEGALKGGEDGKIILPGDSARSPLVLAVARVDERSAMPPIRKPRPGGPPPTAGKTPAQPLTAEQVGLIRAWIDGGAK
jgi:mono/diheme cytochrome c family protein